MSIHPTVYVRNHYNQHVKNVSTKQAMQERAQGVALPLKKFHNEIKRQLIRRFAFNVDSLLDLCCGRGGDLHKWKDAKVKYVKGIDLSPAEIQEAERRYKEMSNDPNCSLFAEFQCTDQLGVSSWEEPQQYDVITCMFSLHYFFFSEDTLRRFLTNVAQNLKPGGYFIGTVPDGKRVLLHLDQKKVFDSPMLKLTQRWEGPVSTFGCAYSCSIADTVTEGHGQSKGSYEFLVFTTPIKHLAATLGLQPVLSFDDPHLESMFEKADERSPFKHFNPSFPRTDPSLETASSLFTAFVFQKVADGERVTVPPRPPPDPRAQSGGGRGPGPGKGQRRPYEDRSGGPDHEQNPPAKRIRPEGAPHGAGPYGGHGSRGTPYDSGGVPSHRGDGPPPGPPDSANPYGGRPHHDPHPRQPIPGSSDPPNSYPPHRHNGRQGPNTGDKQGVPYRLGDKADADMNADYGVGTAAEGRHGPAARRHNPPPNHQRDQRGPRVPGPPASEQRPFSHDHSPPPSRFQRNRGFSPPHGRASHVPPGPSSHSRPPSPGGHEHGSPSSDHALSPSHPSGSPSHSAGPDSKTRNRHNAGHTDSLPNTGHDRKLGYHTRPSNQARFGGRNPVASSRSISPEGSPSHTAHAGRDRRSDSPGGGSAYDQLPEWDEPMRPHPSRPDPYYEPPAPKPVHGEEDI